MLRIENMILITFFVIFFKRKTFFLLPVFPLCTIIFFFYHFMCVTQFVGKPRQLLTWKILGKLFDLKEDYTYVGSYLLKSCIQNKRLNDTLFIKSAQKFSSVFINRKRNSLLKAKRYKNLNKTLKFFDIWELNYS